MRSSRLLAAAALGVAGVYGGMALVNFVRFGRPRTDRAGSADPLLDSFMPDYDIVERHSIVVNAPAALTLAAACRHDMLSSPLITPIFRLRAWAMGAREAPSQIRGGLLESTLSMGWRVLHEIPGEEIVVGAVTQPWQAAVTFRGLEPEAFRAFREPDFVKIAWTLRVDPLEGGDRCVFSTETRALATDPGAARKFRRYWAFVAPGIVLIRLLGLPSLKAAAERARTTRELSPRPS